MLFGMRKVGPRLHFLATCLVAGGTLLSAFWILSVNSWMQTPAGFTIASDGRFLPKSWIDIIFNPSVFVRFPHMILASYLSVAFVVAAVGGFHLLRHRRNEAVALMFSMAMWMATVVAPAQIIMGDIHGLNTLEHQPAKIAALEGDFETSGANGAPLILFGLPDMAKEETLYKVEVPHLSSIILTHTWNGVVPGLKQFPTADRPNAAIIFWSFRVMVGLGMAMAAIGMISLWLRFRHRLYDARWFHYIAVVMGPAGFLALLAGWVTTEVGRQPYTVYGYLRTTDSVSPIGLPGVASSLIAFIIVYFMVFGSGVFFILRLMSHPPHPHEREMASTPPVRAAGLVPGPTQDVKPDEGNVS
jgi:cytochrome d ubiquinol oxidase subunit I